MNKAPKEIWLRDLTPSHRGASWATFTADDPRYTVVVTDIRYLHADPVLADMRRLWEALGDLHDEQNGPPLIRHKDTWQSAYDRANNTLADIAAKYGFGKE